MSDRKFSDALESWLDSTTPTRWRRLRWWAAALYFKTFWRIGFRWRPILRNALLASIPAATPLLAFAFTPETKLTFDRASLWAASIFALTLLSAALQRMLTQGSKDAGPAEEMLMRFGEAISSSKSGSIPVSDREQARKACLSIIEVYVRAISGAKAGEIGVALAKYVGNSTHELRIDDRDKGNKRRTGGTFEGKHNLGHHACISGGDPRPVYDLREFGSLACKSPSGSKSAYRSIFILPIMRNVNGKLRPLGYVSIDSTRPYEFYGNRANVLAVDCAILVRFLEKLM